jgi:hypothetical protein
MLRVASVKKPHEAGLPAELDAIMESVKKIPWTQLQELKGDAELLRKIDAAGPKPISSSDRPAHVIAIRDRDLQIPGRLGIADHVHVGSLRHPQRLDDFRLRLIGCN